MDIGVDINQNHDKFLNKAVAHQNASTPNTSPCSTSTESPTDPKKIQLLDNDFHDDSDFGDHVDDDHDGYDVDNDDDDDEGSSSVSSEEGSVKRRIARWERRLSQGEDLDVTGPVNQGQASHELGQRDLPAPVVIPPTFLHDHGSVSLRENSQAENELSFVRANVIRMKADFQMTELKLSNAKWQYDVNKGTKPPVRSQKRNPALNWSSDNVSLPDIPENMAARRRGEGSPSTAHQMSLASFGNDGRRRDTSGQHRVVNQRILSSPGGQNPRVMMSQSTPSLGSNGSQRHVLSSTKSNQQAITSPSLPANNYGLETMELKLKNMNKQVEKERSPTQRTLVAPLKSFAGTLQNSQRIRGSGGMESHGYQMDHQRRSERSGTTNIPTSHLIPSPRTMIQRGIDERTNQGTPHGSQRDHHQRFERPGTSNLQTSHSIPSPRTIIQRGITERTNQGTPHGSQRDPQQRFERPGTSNLQTSHSIPSPRTIIQSGIAERANQGTPHGSQRDHHQRFERPGTSNIPTSHSIPSPRTTIQRGIDERTNEGTPHGSQRDHHQGFERSGSTNIQTSRSIPSPGTIIQRGIAEKTNQGTPHGSQRDHHQRFERPGTSNIQTSHSVPKTRTILQDDFVARTHQDPYHGYQRDHQQRLERPGTHHSVPSTRTIVQNDIAVRANQGTSYGYQRDSQHKFQTSETSNVQTSHSVPNASTTLQDVIDARTNQDLADLKTERERLLNELGNILLDDVAQQDAMEEEMSSGGISDGSGYDFEDSWDMETSESPVDTNDVGTQFPYPDEGGSSRDTFEAIESMQDESQCLIEGSDEIFQSSDCTFDVCIQVSVRTTTKTTPDIFPDAFHTRDSFENQNELVVDHIDTTGDIQLDNLELEEDAPSMTPLPKTGNTMNEEHPGEEAVEDLVLALNHPNDNAQVNAVGVDRGIELEKLSQEMDGCNEPVEEQPKLAPGFLSHVGETPVNSQSGTKKVVVEEFIPLRKCSKDTVQFSAVGAHHDDLMEELAQEIENDRTNVSPEQREQTPETFSQLDEPSVNGQSSTKKAVVEEFVPYLECSKDTVQFSAVGAHHDDLMEELAKEMENDRTDVSSEQRQQTPETFSQLDEPSVNGQSGTKKVVVEEYIPLRKFTKDTVQLSAVGVHHDDLMEELAQEMEIENTNVNPEQGERTSETVPHVDETSVNSQRVTIKRVVDELVPRVNVSHDNSQLCAIFADHDDVFSAIAAHHDDVLKKPTNEMDTCNIPERTDGSEPFVDGDLNISAVDIKSDHGEPQEQLANTSSRLDQRPMTNQTDIKKTAEEEFVPRLNSSSSDLRVSADNGHSDDGLERPTQEMKKCNNTANGDPEELHSTDDLPAESHPSSELHISENVYDQADPMKETRLDERSSQRLQDTSKEVVEEFVQSLKLPLDEAELSTNDAHHNNALEKLAEEVYKSSNPVVSAEQEMKLTASDRSDLYDDKTPVQDNFCEFRAGDNKQPLNLSKLSSPVEEDNASLVKTKISVGSPSVETAQISSSKDQFNGSDQISHCRVENEAESRENDGMVSVDSEDPVTPNALATIPNPPLEFDFPSLPTPVEDSNESTKEKDLLPQGASNVPAAPRDNDDKPDTDQKNSEQLSIPLDVSAAFENELAFDDLSKDGTRFKDNDDAANQRSPKDINVKDSGVRGPLSPRRSKIPVPKSKLSRSKSCPTRNRSNKKVYKQNSQTPKDQEGALNKRPISDKTLPVNVKTTSPTLVNSFPFRSDGNRRSFKGDKQQNSRIPVPTSNFKRTGSCPSRPRPRIVELNSMSLSNKSKRVPNLTPPTPATRDNTSKTRSRDIDITEALAICEQEALQGDEKSTREIESSIPDVDNSSILLGEKPNDLAADDVQSLNALPSETEKFIQRAKQILSRLPISQTNVPKTRSVPFGMKPTAREESHGSKDVKGPPEEVPYADYPAVSSPEMDIEFLALEADAEDDTASDTFTLHSDNDLDIQSPLYDEVLRIESSENGEDVFESDDQKSLKSGIPVLKECRKPIHSDDTVEERSEPEDEVVSDLSGKERSVARISPMPREDGGELTPMPRFRKSLKSRIPLPSPVAIKPPPRTNRNRSYSETDGGNAINTDEEPDKVSREEPDDTDGENIRDRYSELEEERILRKTQSSREVRPRGSYWAFSTSPSLATSDFERSQTLRPNRSRSTGRKSPAGTPRTTPRGTPRSTPRGTPRDTPRGTPRDTPRGGSLRRQYPHSKTPPTFKSRECAIVPLPEWNRLREVLSSGEQSRQSTRPPSPSEFSYTSRRSSNEFQTVHSPKWEIPVTTPKPSRWRADGRVPSHLKKKYSSMNDMGHSEDFYPSDQNLAKPGIAKPETDSPWTIQSPIRASSSSQSVPHTDRYGVANKSANPLEERSFTDASTSRRRPSCVSETTTDFPMSSTGDVSAIWTEDDTMASSNFSIPAGAKKKSWKKRLSIRRKKSVDPSKEQGKEPEEVRRKKSEDPSKESDQEPEEVKREKKKRKNWLLRFLGIKK
ncbi:uncharacterized protein LOC100892371 isoform X1 [Strongylocentrotus purpuratus]|uniref:Uncharacterized protein n=1 Tax=Strongylocentrotus purpuratus TaxID=7668 RepID=A0A7M7HMD3_STRPU|nr:uncharacterized protein LOC100892371 isoform X1 [Strongylocentrotus purpuratus]